METVRQRVLVVEDDPAVRQLYATALGFAGFAPIPADDGLGALRALEGEHIDAVVLDLNLRCVDGRSVLQEIQGNESMSHIPVIVVAGADIDTRSVPATAVLKKPCGPYRLLRIVARELECRPGKPRVIAENEEPAVMRSCRSRSGIERSATSGNPDSRRRLPRPR